MAKNNPLTYIKKFLDKNYKNSTKVESKTTQSTYYTIDDVKIRLSDHNKTDHKDNSFDIYIVRAINSDKQYIVSIKDNVSMSVMTLPEVKSFIDSFILINRMKSYQVVKKKTTMKQDLSYRFENDNNRLSDFEVSDIGSYLSTNTTWYKKFGDNRRRKFRHTICKNLKTVKDMKEYASFIGKYIKDHPNEKGRADFPDHILKIYKEKI